MSTPEAISTGLNPARRRVAPFIFGVVIALVGSFGIAAPAAHAVTGSAVASIGYNSSISQYQYNCAFAGWGAGEKTWSCNLESYDGFEYGKHSGTFSSTGFSTSTYSFKRTNTTMCVIAKATSSSGSDEDRVCN